MRCEVCHGLGKLKRSLQAEPESEIELPCSDCGGSGISHCCDGICAQPEDASGDVRYPSDSDH